MKRNKWSRLPAAVLALTLLAPRLGLLAGAAAPQPTTDEAVYVNLDEYGALADMRVVKGVTLNGAQALADYGQYEAVYNMTSHDEPSLRDDGVDFTLDGVDGQRFYYECIPSDPASLQMPWTFDVSYKLDGVPAAADALAGAKGLVEMTIHAIPNPAADEYYRNNMTLLVGTGANMDDTKSLEAPGAQIQSMGSYKFAVFMGLPGEENTYTVRIGSDSFESMGIYMLMAPATLSQLDTIADFRNVRDKLEGAHDDVYDGLSALLDTMTGMQGSVQSMADGIAGLDSVRKQLIDARGTIDPDVDAALDVLETLAGDSDALIPELTTLQNNLNALHGNMTGMLATLTESRADITSYQELLKDLKTNLSNLEDFMDDIDDATGSNWLYLDDIRSALKGLRTDSGNLQDELDDLRDELDGLDVLGGSLSTVVQKLSASIQNQIDAVDEKIEALDPEMPGYDQAVAAAQALRQQLEQQRSVLQNLSQELRRISNTLEDLQNASSNTLAAIGDMLGGLNKLLSASESVVDALDDLNDVLEDYKGLGQDTAQLGQQAADLASQTLTRVDDLLAQIEPLQSTLNQINAGSNALIPKVQAAGTSLTGTLRAANTLLTDTRDVLRSVRSGADSSTQQTLDSLIDVLQRAANTGDTTGSLQNATDSIHNTISDEVDTLDEDSNVLNMDNSLALRSFTSDKNASPSSLQFILRTSEISVDEMAEVQAEEAAAEDIGVWGRIVNIFKKLFEAVASVFA